MFINKHIFRVAVIFLIVFLAAPMAAYAGEEPVLRLETGMHGSYIKRIGVDGSGGLMVSASLDKTARIWDVRTGRLLKILRPPIGGSEDGKLYAAALSPDGLNAAVSGWTRQEGTKGHSIYIFDTRTGQMAKRITGLPNVIDHLAYSRDGRYLAATLGGRNGVRVYDTGSWAQVGQDSDYGAASYWCSFGPGNKLATICYDQFLRLYDSNFRLIAKKELKAAKKPFCTAFSHDGELVAAAYSGEPAVEVFSGRDLSFLYTPNIAGIKGGNLGRAAWSADGRYLYLGGRHDRNSFNPILKFSDKGKGSYTSFTNPIDTIMQIEPLPGGGVVYCSADPSWGTFDTGGSDIFIKQQTPVFRKMYEKFKVSNDGKEITFCYEYGGKSPAYFSVRDRRLDTGRDSAPGLAPPAYSAPGVSIDSWKNTYSPKLNGKDIELKKHERSRSAAAMPDGSGMVMGTNWYLRFYDNNGRLKWKRDAPSIAHGVNISGDGKIIVAAYADGTIRWHDVKDGSELLALFPHKDKKRWVMWTPSGFYDASPGAEDLFGWHVGRGRNQAADFFPASRFRTTKYRPDVTMKILETRDEGQALKLAAKEEDRPVAPMRDIRDILPPVLHILSPTSGERVGSNEIDVRYSVRSPGGEPVTGVRVLIDGRPLATQRAIKRRKEEQADGAHTIKVSIPERDCEITLIAENRNAASEPASIRLRWSGQSRDAFSIKPKLYVLAVGVSDYQASDLDLQYAAKDAKDFAETVRGQQGRLYREVEVRLLSDADATRDDILDGLDWIERSTTQHDVAMIFMAGHGVNDKEGFYYFLPGDADTERLRRTGLPFTEIRRTVATLPGKALFFVDTCHAGNVLGGRRGAGDINAVVNELASAENGAVVFTSSSGRQYSLEDPSWGNGAFTKALIEGIKGGADYSKSGKITVNMLDLYISERVKTLTGGKQTPTTTKPETIPDFPVAVAK